MVIFLFFGSKENIDLGDSYLIHILIPPLTSCGASKVVLVLLFTSFAKTMILLYVHVAGVAHHFCNGSVKKAVIRCPLAAFTFVKKWWIYLLYAFPLSKGIMVRVFQGLFYFYYSDIL